MAWQKKAKSMKGTSVYNLFEEHAEQQCIPFSLVPGAIAAHV